MYFIRKVKIPICINEKVTNLDLVVRKCHIFGIKLTESNITEFSKISKKYVHPDLQYIFGQHYMLRMQILFNFSIFNFFVQYYKHSTNLCVLPLDIQVFGFIVSTCGPGDVIKY